jgi:hypothetical protein
MAARHAKVPGTERHKGGTRTMQCTEDPGGSWPPEKCFWDKKLMKSWEHVETAAGDGPPSIAPHRWF